MLLEMANDPIVSFAMHNPDPEIEYNLAIATSDLIMMTGRSDYPNQVNNVLGFYIF
jgi:malate dehydrogenase (oxaloacetate-decarboxylating)(NADP+)